MAKTDETPVEEAPVVDAPGTEADTADRLDVVEEATPEERKAKEKELREARASDSPADDYLAAAPDVGTEIDVPQAVVEVEAPEEPIVEVKLAADFVVPVLEEYTDDKGNPRGRVAGYEAPSDVRVSLAEYAGVEAADEDGYITLPAKVPASVAAQLADNPAVEVAE